jgi:hypothetical protein
MLDIFKGLKDGDFGLAKTYWLFFVLGTLILTLPMDGLTNLVPFAIYSLLCLAYSVTVILGVWNSANRYTGLKLWAILAKLAAIIGFLYVILSILLLLILFL